MKIKSGEKNNFIIIKWLANSSTTITNRDWEKRERENNEDPVCRAIKPNFDIANMQN